MKLPVKFWRGPVFLLSAMSDALLGGRCPYCQRRVFPRDICAHRYICTGRIPQS